MNIKNVKNHVHMFFRSLKFMAAKGDNYQGNIAIVVMEIVNCGMDLEPVRKTVGLIATFYFLVP